MKMRHLASIILAVLFLASIPVALLYTAGYSFNPKRFSFVQTGTLSVNSRPEGARVSLDGRPLADATPTRAARLIPGIYEVKVELPGRHPWQKLLEVKSGRTTLAEFVELYPIAVPERILEGEVTHVAPAPDGSKIFVVMRNRRTLMLTSGASERVTLPQLPVAPEKLDWSRDNPGYLVGVAASSTYLVDPTAGRVVAVRPISLDEQSPRERLVIETDGFDVRIRDLTVVDAPATLITRLGSGVSDVVWNDARTGLFIASGGKLLAIELDDRDRRITTVLADMTDIQKIALSADGRTLYLAGRIGNSSGLYRLRVR